MPNYFKDWHNWLRDIWATITGNGTTGIKIGDGTDPTRMLKVESDGSINVNAELEVGDVEIGAVEIKDGTTDQRAVVTAEGKLKTETDVVIDPPSSIYGNSITLPGVLPNQIVEKGVTIKADEDNADDISVNGFALAAGESIPVECDNLNLVLITGTAGDVAYYLGS